jgi:hypothetical protein
VRPRIGVEAVISQMFANSQYAEVLVHAWIERWLAAEEGSSGRATYPPAST